MNYVGTIAGKIDADPREISVRVTGRFNLVIKKGKDNCLSFKIEGPSDVLGGMSVESGSPGVLEVNDGRGVGQVRVAEGFAHNVAVSVRGSGAVAVGAGAVAVGAGGVRIGGDNTANINTGRGAGVSIGGRNAGTISTSSVVSVGERVIVNGVEVTDLSNASEAEPAIPTLTLKVPAGADMLLFLRGETTIESKVPLGDVNVTSSGLCHITALSAQDLRIHGRGPFFGQAEVNGGRLSFDPLTKAVGTNFEVTGRFREVAAYLKPYTRLTTKGPVAGEYHVTAPDYSTLTHTGPISGEKTDSISSKARVSFD